MAKWKPIDTAPRDRRIIVGVRNPISEDPKYSRIAVAFWVDDPTHSLRVFDEQGEAHITYGANAGWNFSGEKFTPTHWLDVEIPPVPRTTSEA